MKTRTVLFTIGIFIFSGTALFVSYRTGKKTGTILEEPVTQVAATSTLEIVHTTPKPIAKEVVKTQIVEKQVLVPVSTPAATSTVFTLADGAKVDVKGTPLTGVDYFKIHNTCVGLAGIQFTDCVSYSINLPPAIDPENYYNENKTCAGLQYDQYDQCMAYAINLPSPPTPSEYYAQQDANAVPIPPPQPTPGRVDSKGKPLSGPDWYKIYKTCVGAPAYQALGCENYQKSLQQ